MNTPNIPKNLSNSPVNNSSLPNQNNIAGNRTEQINNTFSNSVQRSKTIKKVTTNIISSRGDFVVYLRKSRLDLLTSAVIFQDTGDFILSSYVVYLDHNNAKEPLDSFLQRYPNLVEPIQKINDSLKPLQSNLKIISSS
ncbi:MAG: hypothetical protein H7196_01930 [candidate division SR1 bacterium]|nr:hypothetical protein [candidate division SR1 bacterium]